jgi:ABC-type phosphate transport system substrate-binding protein
VAPGSRGFREIYPGVTLQLEDKGSATAPPALIEGKSQLAPMSRLMTQDEIRAFENRYSALDGAHPLVRFLYIDVNQKPGQPLDRLTGEFAKYALSYEGQEAVVPLPAKIVAETLNGRN